MSRPPRLNGRRWLLKAALQLQKVYDAFHRLLARITGRLGKPMAAEIYFAVRHGKGISVKGRVLLARKWRHPHVNDPPLVNLWQMLRRWVTPERPYSLVRISAGGAACEERADREGYFEIDLPAKDGQASKILIELPESEVSEASFWPITESGEMARALFISDVDDTVLITHAARTLSMIATTLFGNALTRQLFPGTSRLYRALKSGPLPELHEGNPIAYVTSSPYNLHGLLHLIFKENKLPDGAFFMTDWGLDEDRWLTRSHRDHKLDAIETLLSWYPDLPVILIGDTCQHDTAIYIEAALTHPGRIKQILIHKVSPDARIEALGTEVVKLEDTGTRFDFFRDAREASIILAEGGWLSPLQCAEVSEAVKKAPATLLELVAVITGSKPDDGDTSEDSPDTISR